MCNHHPVGIGSTRFEHVVHHRYAVIVLYGSGTSYQEIVGHREGRIWCCGADTDLGVRSASVYSIDTSQYHRVALRYVCIGTNGSCIGERRRGDVGIIAEQGIISTGGIATSGQETYCCISMGIGIKQSFISQGCIIAAGAVSLHGIVTYS